MEQGMLYVPSIREGLSAINGEGSQKISVGNIVIPKEDATCPLKIDKHPKPMYMYKAMRYCMTQAAKTRRLLHRDKGKTTELHNLNQNAYSKVSSKPQTKI